MPSQNMTARMYFDQGRQSFGLREYDSAADLFKKAVDSDPAFDEAHRYLAEAYEKLGYRHRALKAWEALLRITTDAAAKEEINRRMGAVK
jgi:tetratricopeptide (TPR) repeat protein